MEEPTTYPGAGPAADDGGPITGMDGEIVPPKAVASLDRWCLWVDEFLGVGLDAAQFADSTRKIATFSNIDEYRNNPNITAYRTLQFGDITIPPDAPVLRTVKVPSVVTKTDATLASALAPSADNPDEDPLLAAVAGVAVRVPTMAADGAITLHGLSKGVASVPMDAASAHPSAGTGSIEDAVALALVAKCANTVPTATTAIPDKEGLHRTFHRKFNLRIFREGIEPSWEHELNKGGGRYVFRMQAFPAHLRGYPSGVQTLDEIAVLFDEVVALFLDPAATKSASAGGGMVADTEAPAGTTGADMAAAHGIVVPSLPPLPEVGDAEAMLAYRAAEVAQKDALAAIAAWRPPRPARNAAEIAVLRKWNGRQPRFGAEICGVVLHHGLSRGLVIEIWTKGALDPRRLLYIRQYLLEGLPLNQLFKYHVEAARNNLAIGESKREAEKRALEPPPVAGMRIQMGAMAPVAPPPPKRVAPTDPNAITWDDGIPSDPTAVAGTAPASTKVSAPIATDDGIPDAPE